MESSTTDGQSSLVQRMIRAARLEPDVYEEVKADQNAMTEALIVAVIVAIASVIGNGIAYLRSPVRFRSPVSLIFALIVGVSFALIFWVVWAYVTYFVGTHFFESDTRPGELLRTLGFAQTPGVLYLLRFIPVLGVLISIAAVIWVIVAGVIAIRQALDFDTGKAILTAVISGVIAFAVFYIVYLVLLAFAFANG